MFKLDDKFEVDRGIRNCNYISSSLSETSTKNAANIQKYTNIPRENGVIQLINSYIELNFEVIIKADITRYGDGNDKRLVIFGPIASFSK